MAASVFDGRLGQANLIFKTDFDAKLSRLNRKFTANKTKHLLVENELKKLKTFDSSYFTGKTHFEEDVTQNVLVFQPTYRYFKRIAGVGNSNYISYWKSKGLSRENITPPAIPDNSLTPQLSYYGTKTRVKFTGICLKQDKITYNHKNVVNIHIVYELHASSSHSDNSELQNCLFGAVTLTKNADIDK